MTTIIDAIKQELMQTAEKQVSARRAEVCTIFRLSGEIHSLVGGLVLQAEFDIRPLAVRTRSQIDGLYGQRADLFDVAGRHLVRVTAGGSAFARQTGLVDNSGRPIRGLPASLVAGTVADAGSVWRTAILTKGSLSEPGRTARLEISCPSPEVGLALVGLARRLGFAAKARTSAGGEHQVVVPGTESVVGLLSALGAPETIVHWRDRHFRRSQPAQPNSSANFNDANRHRMARAAATTSARVSLALELLGDSAPAHLVEAGRLRLQHSEASLEELGKLAEPLMTKDSIAGRIRRLLALADRAVRRSS